MEPTLVDICLRAYPDVLLGDPDRVPKLETRGDLDLTFAFIQEHLQFVLQELLKNAMRATIERYYAGSA